MVDMSCEQLGPLLQPWLVLPNPKGSLYGKRRLLNSHLNIVVGSLPRALSLLLLAKMNQHGDMHAIRSSFTPSHRLALCRFLRLSLALRSTPKGDHSD